MTRIEELRSIRRGLALHLGLSLYEQTKDDPELRHGRERLYDGIARIDAELARLEEPNPADASAPVCPNCGAPVEPTHKFCVTCGHPLR